MDTITAATPFVDNGPLAQLVDMGGPVMIVLIAIAAIGVITFFYLMLFGAFYAPRLTRKLKDLVHQWQASPAKASPEKVRSEASFFGRNNPLMHLLVNSMSASQTNPNISAIRETAVRDAQAALEPFEAPLKIIEVIAALAPLLGLLGTVMGMMEAFSAMAATEGRANASQLSGGIYEALTTTAAGLVVAIPFAALAAWIEFRLRRIHKTINSTLVSVFNVLPATEQAEAPQADPVTAPSEPSRENQNEPEPAYSVGGNPRLAHATG
ncbi:MotA/TolQ/ExbB proton channel family protein [Marinobacter daepoensis]|uniref:MotA/TolQ/ExbB proton channel family protein n=1 Tax=Marinobacter daepoensis TaxID=262077 RepID=UPI001C9518DB|nr:MotA/TolQ/ExbB proton channel family protein [Marinobacter daepoensis]MBY6032756.1 MotA/TolQ/ExbB proton channel family protein [Marinobacter daepoensis]